MKAKEYVQQYRNTGDFEAKYLILDSLAKEANDLAKKRNCHGGAGTNTTFGAYADCYFEQFVKWVAICRLDNRFELGDFIQYLHFLSPQILSIIKSKIIPYLRVHENEQTKK